MSGTCGCRDEDADPPPVPLHTINNPTDVTIQVPRIRPDQHGVFVPKTAEGFRRKDMERQF